MKVALCTSVSSNIAELATLTVPNKLQYCLQHGYSLVVDNQPYEEAMRNTHYLCELLDRFDLIWALDADAIITDMSQPIHTLSCLGPHVTVCEEGAVEWNWINCGSMVWKNTLVSRTILQTIAMERERWDSLPCQWQTWLGGYAKARPEYVTVAPLRSFNSCLWNRPGNGEFNPGGHWEPGDFVYHPCGVFPPEEKLRWIQNALSVRPS
jgi:hypothetical protein